MPKSPKTSPTASAARSSLQPASPPGHQPTQVVLVPVPRRLIAVGKPIPPLSIDPPQVPREGRQVPTPSVLPKQAPAPEIASITDGLWAYRADLVLADGPRITSQDFALLALVDCWLNQISDPDSIHACDLLNDVFQHAAGLTDVKKRLMGTWLQPFTPKPDFPLHNEKSFLQSYRSLDAAGWISRDAQSDLDGTHYLVAPSIYAIYRCMWMSRWVGHQLPALTNIGVR